MTSNDYQALIMFDPDIRMFRREFAGLNGGADFYVRDVDGLRRACEISLPALPEACAEEGMMPDGDTKTG